MSEQDKEEMPEFLSDKKDFPALKDDTFESAAREMMNLDTSEPMPACLRMKIAADAEKYFALQKEKKAAEPQTAKQKLQKIFKFEPKNSIRQWLGWAVAAAACAVLGFNIYTTRINPTEIGGAKQAPTAMPKIEFSAAREREQLLVSARDVVQSAWGDFDPKKPKNIQGDVVWSNSAQKGFIRFRNLPANDKTKQQYQLWIFDENQKYPVDGGVFDSEAAGEIVIPIDAKIKVQKPVMFAVTAEKPGGVVVSSREKVMAVAKVAA